MAEHAIIDDECRACDGTDRGDDWDGTCVYCSGGRTSTAVSFCSFCGDQDCQCGEADEHDRA